MHANSTLKTAFFGRSGSRLSCEALEVSLGFEELDFVSVTCGRREEDQWAAGPLHQIAAQAGIPIMSFHGVRSRFTDLDLVISYSNPVIFPADFIEKIRFGIVNMHPAPLPAFRGSHGIEHAILGGEPRFGVTLHYCDEKIDTGPLIDIRWIDIDAGDVARDVWEKVDTAAIEQWRDVLPRLIDSAQAGVRLESRVQDNGAARHFMSGSLPAEMDVDPGWAWEKIVRHVRAWEHPFRTPATLTAKGIKLYLYYRRGNLIVTKTPDPPPP